MRHIRGVQTCDFSRCQYPGIDCARLEIVPPMDAQPAVYYCNSNTVSQHLHGIVSVAHSLPIVPDYELTACTSV